MKKTFKPQVEGGELYDPSKPGPTPQFQISDEHLCQVYASTKDMNILGELFARYSHLLLGVCLKYLKDEDLARDAVQDIFAELVEKLEKYEVKKFKSWLYTLSRNHCLMVLRLQKPTLPLEFVAEAQEPGVKEDDGLGQADPETLLALQQALLQLTPGQRKCIELRFFGDLSYQEIMQVTGLTFLQVRSNLENGKRMLAKLLQGVSWGKL
ncbi:MAG: sigma-70 family RNA polymerase sigma factor [Bacteroidia bacterium]|nr:sigma-70 family RNA polymerase sigma factor [Bacteroidia bacterium]